MPPLARVAGAAERRPLTAMCRALLVPLLLATCTAGQSQESAFIVKNIRQALDSTSGEGRQQAAAAPPGCRRCRALTA